MGKRSKRHRGGDAGLKKFETSLQMKDVKLAMKTYKTHQLKGRLSMAQITTVRRAFCHKTGKRVENETNFFFKLQVMEDHIMFVADKCTSLEYIIETIWFYYDLASLYEYASQHSKANKYIEKAFEISLKVGDITQVCFIGVKLIENCLLIGQLEKASTLLPLLYKAYEQMNHDREMKVGYCYTIGYVKEKIFVAHNATQTVQSRSDEAEDILNMYRRACDLATLDLRAKGEMLEAINDLATWCMCYQNIGRFYGVIAEYDLAISFFMKTVERAKEINSVLFTHNGICRRINFAAKSFEYSGRMHLQKLYHCTSIGKPIDQNDLLRTAKKYTRRASRISPNKEQWLDYAIEQFVSGATDKAFKILAIFLDGHILCKKRCGECRRSDADMIHKQKVCSGCHMVHYCGEVCQRCDWKPDSYGEVPHKKLCPLMAYWHEKWGNDLYQKKMTDGPMDPRTRWFDNEHSMDLLTETCRGKFNQFFESVVDKSSLQGYTLSLDIMD